MLFHVLDPEVAKDPRNLVVYGGSGKAAMSWDDFEAIVDSLISMEGDDTLVIQSGQPVAMCAGAYRAPGLPATAPSQGTPKKTIEDSLDMSQVLTFSGSFKNLSRFVRYALCMFNNMYHYLTYIELSLRRASNYHVPLGLLDC